MLIHVGPFLGIVLLACSHPVHAQQEKVVEGLKIPEPKAWTDADYAGIPASSHPEVLTWERAYTLALIRHRNPQPAGGRVLAETLDPKALADQAERLGVGDFERFRKDFFSEGSARGAFVDPSGSVFDLQSRLWKLENAKRMVDALGRLKKVLQELLMGESTQLGQHDLDEVDLSLQKERRRFLEELRGYRDRLDEIKVELGLSPHASVVPDGRSLARFRSVFEKVDHWQHDPERKMEELPRIVAGLPALGDALLDQLAARPVADLLADTPGKLEEVNRAAEQAAIENPGAGEPADVLRLRVRRRVRSLLQIWNAYEVEKRSLMLAIRVEDQVFERMIAPPALNDRPPSRASLQTLDWLPKQAQVIESENQLVTHWITFHAEQLALARDLRMLPARDWKSFYDQIDGQTTAKPGPSATPPPVRKAPPR
jgi:hypothetical protein